VFPVGLIASDIVEQLLTGAGRDFWLTRNRHGAGYWDRGLRPFPPGFLNKVHEARATLLGHALTIWRAGRRLWQRKIRYRPPVRCFGPPPI
jgi:hypothetical protein